MMTLIFIYKKLFLFIIQENTILFLRVCAETVKAMLTLLKCLFVKFKGVILQLILFEHTYTKHILLDVQFFLFSFLVFKFT